MDNQGENEIGTDQQKFQRLAARSQNVIYKIYSSSFLNISPIALIIDENKVTIVSKHFLGGEEITAMPIQELKSVNISMSMFSAMLTFDLDGYEDSPPFLKGLKKDEALKARRIILGLIVCRESGIDLTKVEAENMVWELENIGLAKE